jgi:hypothetical protein
MVEPRSSRQFPLMVGAILVLAVVAAMSSIAWGDGNHGGQPNDKLPVYLDRTVHPTAQDCPGFIWAGAGNTATTFQRKRNLDAGVELAIKGKLRQGGDLRSSYVDGDGLVHIEVPTGSQPTVANRAAWNFDYSYDVALDPSNPPLDRYHGELWIDLDPSKGTRYLKLRLARLAPNPGNQTCPTERDLNGLGWKSGNTEVIPDDEGDPASKVTQNSQNYAFYSSLIDSDPGQRGVQPYAFGPAEFDVVMILSKKGAKGDDDEDDDNDDYDDRREKTILHVVFDVGEPSAP